MKNKNVHAILISSALVLVGFTTTSYAEPGIKNNPIIELRHQFDAHFDTECPIDGEVSRGIDENGGLICVEVDHPPTPFMRVVTVRGASKNVPFGETRQGAPTTDMITK